MPDTRQFNADEYYLDDDMFDGNDAQIDGLKERLRAYREIAEALAGARNIAEVQPHLDRLFVVADEKIDVPIADIPFWHESVSKTKEGKS